VGGSTQLAVSRGGPEISTGICTIQNGGNKMSTQAAPVVSAAPESELQKIWNWLKAKVVIVEEDLAKVLGSKVTADLEVIGKQLLDSWLGPLATTAIADATDIVSGSMSVSKAISNLVTSAAASGKKLSQAAALQAIALVQNAVPTANDPTVTPTT
jgi:hypothetical protein